MGGLRKLSVDGDQLKRCCLTSEVEPRSRYLRAVTVNQPLSTIGLG